MLDRTLTSSNTDFMSNQISDNIQRLLESSGRAAREVSESAGLNKAAIRDIITGRARSPRHDTLVKIANELGVRVDEITGIHKTSGEGLRLSPQDVSLIHYFRQLSPGEREFVLSYVEFRAKNRSVSQDLNS